MSNRRVLRASHAHTHACGAQLTIVLIWLLWNGSVGMGIGLAQEPSRAGGGGGDGGTGGGGGGTGGEGGGGLRSRGQQGPGLQRRVDSMEAAAPGRTGGARHDAPRTSGPLVPQRPLTPPPTARSVCTRSGCVIIGVPRLALRARRCASPCHAPPATLVKPTPSLPRSSNQRPPCHASQTNAPHPVMLANLPCSRPWPPPWGPLRPLLTSERAALRRRTRPAGWRGCPPG